MPAPPIHRLRRRVVRAVPDPVLRFLAVESSAAIVLAAATIAALIWANLPAGRSYHAIWHDARTVGLGDLRLTTDLAHAVGDGLMVLFFFVVALEIKVEVTEGSLSDRREAALPVLAAIGGMVVPALAYRAFNPSGPGAAGWGVPMATDLAFALGVMALLGRRVPTAAKVLLLALAVADDVGAIVVIAVAYTADLSPAWLAVAVAAVVLAAVAHRRGLGHPLLHLAIGVACWVAMVRSGVHATLAGVALGLVVPPALAERWRERLHPTAAYLVLPLFALSHAGVPLGAHALAEAARSPIALGVAAGLVVGKPVGILAAAWLALRTGVARLPDGVTWRHLGGIGALAGIGFTVAVFVAGLAFPSGALLDEALVGILGASVLAAVAGTALLRGGTAPEDVSDQSGSAPAWR